MIATRSRTASLLGWFRAHPPPGPFRPAFWRSPLRGPWLTSVLGAVLLVGIPLLFLTGLLSYAAYNPDLGGANEHTGDKGLLGVYLFDWPTRPVWLYRLTQGIHVIGGLALVPVLMAKLWSVIPKLFSWPPAKSPAQAVERLSLLLLVGGGVLTFATGIINIQYWYVFPAGFYATHLYGSWIFIAALIVHVVVRFRRLVTSLGGTRLRDVLRTRTAETCAEPADPAGLVAAEPAAPTMSRRGALAFVAGGSLLLTGLSIGQTVGGPTARRLALLAPRGGYAEGSDPNDYPVNKTAAARGVTAAQTGSEWRLRLRGDRTLQLSRDELMSLPLHTARFPLACVEGWSTVRTWTGVRLADLAAMVDVPEPADVFVQSLQQRGSFGSVFLRRNQILDSDALLVLRVNDVDLSLDHGFPARIMVPNNPGVHNTKWVSTMTFRT